MAALPFGSFFLAEALAFLSFDSAGAATSGSSVVQDLGR